MYFNVQDAVTTATFAKDDVEYYKRDREYAYSELRNSRERCSKKVYQLRDLRKEVEKLQSDLEEETRCHRKSEYTCGQDCVCLIAPYPPGSAIMMLV